MIGSTPPEQGSQDSRLQHLLTHLIHLKELDGELLANQGIYVFQVD